MSNKRNSEFIIDIIGGRGYYQLIVGLLILVISSFMDFAAFYIPLIMNNPLVKYTNAQGVEIIEKLTYDICDKYPSFDILNDNLKSSFLIDYKFYCKKLKVSICESIIYFGAVCGGFTAGYIQKFGIKNSYCICSLLYSLITILLVFDSYYSLIICHFFYGFCIVCGFVFKTAILTEITNNQFRSYLMNLNFLGNVFTFSLFFFIFQMNIEWKLVYIGVSCFVLIFVCIFYFFAVENPRIYYIKEDYEKMFQSIKYIMRINRRTLNDEQIKLLNTTEEINECINEKNLTSTDENLSSTLIEKEGVKGSSFHNFGLLFLLFVGFSVNFTCLVFELKNYSTYMDDLFYLMNILMFCWFILTSYLMNIKIFGRVRLLFLYFVIFGILVSLKSFANFSIYQETYIFLSAKILIYSTQIILHTFISESLPITHKSKKYGIIYSSGKIISLFGPFIQEYLSNYYNYILLSITTMFLILLMFAKETLNKPLKD